MQASRNYLIATLIAATIVLAACRERSASPSSTTFLTDTTTVDSVSLALDSEEAYERPMPKAADELFDDFIFNFATSKKLQLSRTRFPLAEVRGQRVDSLTRQQWRMDYFFMQQDYYTLLFDDEQQMDIVKDTRVNHVVLEKIYFNTKSIKQYVFDRIDGLWTLQRIEYQRISQSHNGSFLEFYERFVNDTTFQEHSLGETVHFVGPDPDDDFSQMEGEITPDTWPAFAPELPQKMIYNIVYGKAHQEKDHKVFVMRGIANGMEMQLSFRRNGGKWKLVKMAT